MSQSELERLRALLLAPEQEKIKRLEDERSSAQDELEQLTKMLPTAIQRSVGDVRLAQALREPIRFGLRSAVTENPQALADVLFPIMGPSIRRAIVENLRDLVNGLNASVSQALSWQGLKWRVEGWRTGRSYGEVVLRHTLSYRVEQALLIHKDSGLVISKAEIADVVANDSDAFSAMLNAIQDFVSDSLRGDSVLSTLDMGERTIWLIRGPHAYLACVISGVPKSGLREFLADQLDTMHAAYGALITDYSGDADTVAGINLYCEQCLGAPIDAEAAKQAPPRWPAVALLAALLVLGLWWLAARDVGMEARIRSALVGSAGVVVNRIHEDHERWVVDVLVDPLAADPASALESAGIALDQLELRPSPFLSLAPAIVLQRARRSLQAPDSAALELVNGVLWISGTVSWDLLQRWRQITHWPAGVESIDVTSVEIDYGLESIRSVLPERVSVDVRNDSLLFSGVAPIDWIRNLPVWAAQYSTVPLSKEQNLRSREAIELAALQAQIAQSRVYFGEMAEETDSGRAMIPAIRKNILKAAKLAGALERTLVLKLTAYSDGLGPIERNREVRLLRNARVQELLEADGELPLVMQLKVAPGYIASELANPELRRVDLELKILAGKE